MNRRGSWIRALAGHLIDLYGMMSFEVANPHGLSKFRNIKSLARRTGARVFVEAGTYRGVTTARCARLFDRVFTVELDRQLAADAAVYLRRWPNIELFQGDALTVVPSILSRGDVEDVLIFLDGHFSGGVTALGEMSEPAVEELRLLGAFRSKIRGIIIDDFRGFGVYEDWPAKSSLFRVLEEQFPGFDVMVHLDQVIVGCVGFGASGVGSSQREK